eukprot:2087842-Rhodomonas_salina.2
MDSRCLRWPCPVVTVDSERTDSESEEHHLRTLPQASSFLRPRARTAGVTRKTWGNLNARKLKRNLKGHSGWQGSSSLSA